MLSTPTRPGDVKTGIPLKLHVNASRREHERPGRLRKYWNEVFGLRTVIAHQDVRHPQHRGASLATNYAGSSSIQDISEFCRETQPNRHSKTACNINNPFSITRKRIIRRTLVGWINENQSSYKKHDDHNFQIATTISIRNRKKSASRDLQNSPLWDRFLVSRRYRRSRLLACWILGGTKVWEEESVLSCINKTIPIQCNIIYRAQLDEISLFVPPNLWKWLTSHDQ